jgi:hypothetical protein
VGRYVKKGGHGGSRRGAGRPSLSKKDRLLLGAETQEDLQTPGAKLPRDDLLDDEIKESREALEKVPDRKRLPADAQEHLDWLREELDGKRVVRAERRLLRDVLPEKAAEVSKRYGIPISERQIRRYRDLYLATKTTEK